MKVDKVVLKYKKDKMFTFNVPAGTKHDMLSFEIPNEQNIADYKVEVNGEWRYILRKDPKSQRYFFKERATKSEENKEIKALRRDLQIAFNRIKQLEKKIG
jgi:hypothetical protein